MIVAFFIFSLWVYFIITYRRIRKSKVLYNSLPVLKPFPPFSHHQLCFEDYLLQVLISPEHFNVAELNGNLINFYSLSHKVILVFVWNIIIEAHFIKNCQI